ncbi:hypothetical protein ACIBJD_33775 [Kitasatospora sp. NPDC050467]|uniref:hypothetical protein n=1 Tax=Kitasatospora sp. NPDC050467 TaxID=3364053 RepID=UPI0037B08036
MMNRLKASLAGLGLAFIAVALPVSTASATVTGNCDNAPTNLSKASAGSAQVWWCGNHVWGWVRDDKADGLCPYVTVFIGNGDNWENSPSVGPKGAVKNFDWYTAQNVHSAGLWFRDC